MAEPTPNRPPNGAVRVALAGTCGGHNFVNRFWLNAAYTGTPTAADVLALSNSVSLAWRTRFLPFLASTVTLTHQRTVLYVSPTLEIGVDGADTGSGTASGSPTMPQVCYLINWAISGTYRGGHPRTYLPQPSSSDVAATGVVNTTPHANLTTAAGNFLLDVNGLTGASFTSIQLGTIRFFRAHSALAPPVFEPFLAGSCHPRAATQRRRAGT